MKKDRNFYLEEQILLLEKSKKSTSPKADAQSIYPDTSFEFQYPAPVFDPNLSNELAGNNIYYLWWKYLSLNNDYQAYYKNGVVPSEAQKKVFDDFGNIYRGTFRDWWETHHMGTKLFLGTTKIDKVKLVPSYDLVDPSDFDREIVYLRVPLRSQSKRELQQWFSNFLKKFHKGKRGHHKSRAIEGVYQVLGRPKLESLKLHLDIYEYYQANPQPLWRIAQAKNLEMFNSAAYLEKYPDVDARNVMSATISRHLKKANILIQNTALGRFPDYEDHSAPTTNAEVVPNRTGNDPLK
jgi:hypothetical protein